MLYDNQETKHGEKDNYRIAKARCIRDGKQSNLMQLRGKNTL